MAYTHRYAEASKLFRDAIEKQDNSEGQGNRWSVWYAFACVAVAANRPDDALQYLREAINRGYKDADGLMADDDLKKLRQNPHFQQLVAELKRPPQKFKPNSESLPGCSVSSNAGQSLGARSAASPQPRAATPLIRNFEQR